MSARKSERIMNLTICLLMARRFLPREHLREAVEGYHGLSDAAFERTFERDKEELRALGVPVETGSNSSLFPDEVGYRIRRADFELPPLEFDASETAALGLAAGVWDQARLADDTVRAVAKLRAAGVEPDAERVASLSPRMDAREPAFEVLWQAMLSRTRVRIRYHDVDRVVDPWTLTYRHGAWYLSAFDPTHGEERQFKVARIQGESVAVGPPDAFAPPTLGSGPRRVGVRPSEPDAEALLAVRAGSAPDLRRRCVEVSDVKAPVGYIAHRLVYGEGSDVVGELASYGDDVVVLGPDALRVAMVAHLRGLVGGAA